MAQRRHAAAAGVMAVLMMLAGCGFITGSEALTFSASPATVSDSALQQTGFEEVAIEEQVVERNFSAAGQTRSVEVTNQLAKYERQVDLGPLGSQRAAVFVAFTSPEVSVLGQSFNPIAEMSTQELLSRFESQYEGMSVGSQVNTRTVQALGEARTVDKYEGTARIGGQQIDVYIEITDVFSDGSDYVVAVGIYPQQSSDGGQRIATLLQGLEHESN